MLRASKGVAFPSVRRFFSQERFLIDSETDIKRARTLWEYLRQGFIEAHKRRPMSFYLLLLIPIVLLLGVHIAEYRGSPRRFAALLSLLLVFFWIITKRAFNDLFALYRKHRSDKRAAYLDTIGNRDFVESLGKGAHRNKPGGKEKE